MLSLKQPDRTPSAVYERVPGPLMLEAMSEHEPSRLPLAKRRRLAAIATVLLALVVVAVVLQLSPVHAVPSSPSAISTDPGRWRLPALGAGSDISLSDFRGTPLVVTFFASWCNACKDELPAFAAASLQLGGQVTFVGVNSEETGDGMAMAKKFGIANWPLARDVNGNAQSGLHDALGRAGMPTTAFYAADGRLLYVAPGSLTGEQLHVELVHLFPQLAAPRPDPITSSTSP